MSSSRGPDWDFYQCKCGNIVFEYNIITGEKCLSDTWKNCTTTCMEPVSYVPPCARPFTTIRIPVSCPKKNMATQTSEEILTRSVDTQTPAPSCGCYSSSAQPPNACCCSTQGKDESESHTTNTNVESENDLSQEKPEMQKDLGNHVTSNAEDSLVETENTSEPATGFSPLSKGKSSKAKEDPTPTNGSQRVLRKRNSVGNNGLGKEARRSKKPNKRV